MTKPKALVKKQRARATNEKERESRSSHNSSGSLSSSESASDDSQNPRRAAYSSGDRTRRVEAAAPSSHESDEDSY